MIQQLGGIFITSKQAATLAQWYIDNLKLELCYTESVTCWWVSFNYFNDNDSRSYTNFSISQSNETQPTRIFTINFRIENMDQMIAHLTSKNILIDGPKTYDEGIFAWVFDADGNKIELWEDTKMME